jgi:tRNA A-37 threonylcarbamoyl transferase component Bud32
MLSTAKLIVAPEWQTVFQSHGFNSVAALYTHEGGDVLKRSPTTEVRRLTLADRTVFLKKYWSNTFRQRWSGALRGSFFGKPKVRREYENLQRLREWGLNAPAPVAYGEERRGGWLVRSLLVSEAILNPVTLDDLIVNHLPPNRRTELIESLADYVRRLHQHQFVHCDLYWRNIILSGQSFDAFNLIDSHKGHTWRAGHEQNARAEDLATLDAPAPFYFRRPERLRFFLRYQSHARLTDTDKALIERTLALAGPMRERQLKRIREARR